MISAKLFTFSKGDRNIKSEGDVDG